MPISPEYAFATCWEVYQRIQSEAHGIAILQSDAPSGCGSAGWRPPNTAEGKDYAADFALAGQKALEGPEHASRLILFRVYHLGLAPYDEARRSMGVGEKTWAQWSGEIEDQVGRELMRRGLFPPRNYFGERTRPRTPRKERADGSS